MSELEAVPNVAYVIHRFEEDGKQVLGYTTHGENVYLQWENEQDIYLSHLTIKGEAIKVLFTTKWLNDIVEEFDL